MGNSANQALTTKSIETRRVSTACGAEITGVDLKKPLGPAQVTDLHRALGENGILLFRNCDLTPEEHVAFSRHFGDADSLLSRYAWYDGNTHKERMHPVASLLPNQWGLYDMLGNAWEWTFDRRQSYPVTTQVTEDIEDSVVRVTNDVARTRRGGSFAYEWFTVRSAHRGDITYFPNQTRDGVGFRVARSMP